MKLLQKGCLALQQKSICHTIDCLTIKARVVIERNKGMIQGRSQCKKCYSVLYRDRTLNTDNYLKDSLLKRHTEKKRRMCLFPSFHTSLYNLHKVKQKVYGQLTGIKELNTISNYNTYHKQCIKQHCAGLLTGGYGKVWQHIDQRGMKSGHVNGNQEGDQNFYPLDRLQKFVSLPLLSEEDYVFRSPKDKIIQAQKMFISTPNNNIQYLKMFISTPNNNIQYLKSALFEDQLPSYELPEVAFIGRSNVGKSSLIAMLLNNTDVLVHTSKKPGHTKLLNFFQIGKKFTLVDMPGYGHNMPKHYTESVEKFLYSRKKLSRTFILIDSTVGVTENDVIGLNMLEEFHIPYVVVLTKIDKTRPAVLVKSFMSVLNYRDKTQHCFSQPFLVSSKTGEGVPLLQTFIAYVTGNIILKGL